LQYSLAAALSVIAILFFPSDALSAVSADRPAASSALPDGTVTLEECLRIALDLNPGLAETKSGIDSQAARVREAAAASRPQVGLSSSYGYTHTGNAEQGSINTGFTLRQSIFDWGRADLSVRGASLELEAKTLDRANDVQGVLAQVTDAYYMVNRSARNLMIATERVGNYEKRLKWAKDFYAAGAKAKIDVTKAETDLANARLDLVQANGASAKALSGLSHSMGAAEWTPPGVEDLLEYTSYDIAAEEAVNTALGSRTDLMAQEVRLQEARTSLSLASKGLSPSFSGSAGYSFYGESDPFGQKEWRLSAGIEIPLSDGGLTRERVRGAEADLAGAESRLAAMRQDIILAARNAHSSLAEAREAVAAAREVERQAGETLNLALGRYGAGVGESLEISDAVDGYAQARVRVVTALYDLKSAEINLKRTMGVISQ
jgi:outer membrane protein TolC